MGCVAVFLCESDITTLTVARWPNSETLFTSMSVYRLCQSEMAQCTANFTRVILQLLVRVWAPEGTGVVHGPSVMVCGVTMLCVPMFQARSGAAKGQSEEQFVAQGMGECLVNLPLAPDFAMTEFRTLLNIKAKYLTFSETPPESPMS